MPNKIFNSILGSSSSTKERGGSKVKTSGKLYNWCQDQLKPLGLHIDEASPYQLAVYREGNVVGYYSTLSEIKKAIQGKYVHQSYNL